MRFPLRALVLGMPVLSMLSLQPCTVFAQGTAFTYQGVLSDAGAPASGIYDLRFAIYDAVNNGIAVGGARTNTATPITNGLFTVALDFGAVFNGDARWLEIGARPNGSAADFNTLSPRQPLTPTPYAIRAANFSGPVAASQLTGTISSNNIGAGSITTVMLATGAVGSNQLASGAVTAAKVATVSNWFALTIANPSPATGDRFGIPVTTVGSDRLLIGAWLDDTSATDAGVAYLFSANGALLSTFTNPTPVAGDWFGFSMAAVGSDGILIGVPNDNTGASFAGLAYLFSTNGALLTTFTNPTPAFDDNFAFSVAAVGTDRVLIGARYDDTGAGNAGAAYLFSTNGALLTTFTNPTPVAADSFAVSVAAVGSDLVMIGAPYDDAGATDAGVAYLFSTNGALLTTFTNPTPAASDWFGWSVAAVGADRVLIGAWQDDTGATDAGAAYLFSTNGALLTTFTSPAPASGDNFGIAVATVGSDRVLVGAWKDDTGATDGGAAYLFSTNGALLTTFTNPTPAGSDWFGNSVAALDSDRVLIGANADNTGASDAGAVYLFNLESFTPRLVADGVHARAITTASLEDGAVTATKIGGALFASQIPDLDASKIASGMISTNRIPNLDASKISSGIFGTNRIPNLDASKIVSGTLGDARLSANVALRAGGNAFIGNQTVAGGRVGIGRSSPATALDVNGTVTASNFVGALAASQLTGSISSSNIAAGSITTAMLAAGAVGTNQLATGAVTTTALTDGAVTVAKVATLTVPLTLTTLPNPTPAALDYFGSSVAAVGTDRVLIGSYQDDTGAEDAGAAFLFNANGTLLTAFTNPTPAYHDWFGHSVAAVGSDRVLIAAPGNDTGAVNAGVVYLFSINGALLTTITNPTSTSEAWFGSPVAAVGSDRVVIGAPNEEMAYLFGTNGALLATFANPTPSFYDHFGVSVAALGIDRVLIGAANDDTGAQDAGAAYLFSVNGTLLTTFTNPTPADRGHLGSSVAAVGTDRVLVGAPTGNTGAGSFGAAYLFSTNGALVATFRNPTPEFSDSFGISVAAAGTDRVLIGAYGDTAGAYLSGAAYLFSINGRLLTTFTNPTPAYYDLFGYSLVAVGTDRVLIGAPGGEGSAGESGAAYLFSLETYTPGMIADGVRDGSINTFDLADGTVTQAKLDPTIGIWTRAGNDVFRVTGKVGIGTSSFTSNRLEVAGMVGATAFNTTSDRATKQDFTAVDAQAVLARVVGLPITQWRFKEFSGALHLGPMAQDFRAAFGLGMDDKHIATVDADGVALAAIQGLNEKVETGKREAETRLEQLEAENAELKARLEKLERLLSEKSGSAR